MKCPRHSSMSHPIGTLRKNGNVRLFASSTFRDERLCSKSAQADAARAWSRTLSPSLAEVVCGIAGTCEFDTIMAAEKRVGLRGLVSFEPRGRPILRATLAGSAVFTADAPSPAAKHAAVLFPVGDCSIAVGSQRCSVDWRQVRLDMTTISAAKKTTSDQAHLFQMSLTAFGRIP